MAGRLHVHLSVANLDSSHKFYEKFLGVTPVKQKADLVKFVPAFAPINLTISPAKHDMVDGRAMNHLGIEMESNEVVIEYLERIKADGIAARAQFNVTCCYANQSKFWVVDPDGVEWEVYHVNYDTAEKHGGAVETICCQPTAAVTG
jgi:catechol 2,3-dioxygenase-like lactoylglutathione lyase family enzyme